jgi:hypothetical protein
LFQISEFLAVVVASAKVGNSVSKGLTGCGGAVSIERYVSIVFILVSGYLVKRTRRLD